MQNKKGIGLVREWRLQVFRASGIRLNKKLHNQLKQRRGLSIDFLCLKASGYKPVFRGVISIQIVL